MDDTEKSIINKESKPFAICMLSARFFPHMGGSEMQALYLSKKLIEKGHKVFVCTQRYKKDLKSFEVIENVPVYRLFDSGVPVISSFVFMLSSFCFLLKHREVFDVIHVHLASSPALTALLFGRMFRKKVLIKFAGARATGDIETSKKKILGRLKLFILKKYAPGFICPSGEVRDEMLRQGFWQEKINLIPNGVDIERFSPALPEEKLKLKKELLPDANSFYVIYTGRLEEGKGLECLLDAWDTVASANKNAILVVVGEGRLKQKLVKVCKEKKIEKEVLFIGRVNNVEKYLKACDLFVLPSFGEGLSNALLEAMSCGLLVLASDIGGNREAVISGHNGFLFTSGDANQLAEKINLIIKRYKEFSEISKNARATVEKNYSFEIITSKYEELYKK